MSILELLKSEKNDIRLTNTSESKWLVWFEDSWAVFYKGRGGSKSVKTLIQTDDIETALQVLIQE